MLMLPNVHDNAFDVHKMFIDRSNLLVDSFESIAHAQLDFLRAGLYIEFMNEEATGFGVMREWFFLVCREIFNPKNGLFIACPNDGRRFFLNPASKANPVNLQYYIFAGRVIALALMRKIHVGITFDRSFFVQLAGNKVSLEDIKDAEPQLYSSWNQILEMDPFEVDIKGLELCFVWQEEQGFGIATELCPGGQNMLVDSTNREDYIDLLVQYRFLTSTSEQMTHFFQGFTDIVGEERTTKMCFRALEHKDQDLMLCGSECDISLEAWKAHTEYQGYEKTDPQICWFWEIVGGMTSKQRRGLLFFWTSMKYLSVEGFCGFNSMLSIIKSHKSTDHLPSSHTCFYKLCLPAYPSLSEMQSRLSFIIQDHVCYSFGES